jgi:hypothetical protein
MGVGFYEVATFPIPPYGPVIKPEFVFADEDEWAPGAD